MTEILGIIQAEHRNMARLLDMLEHQISLFEQSLQPDYDLMREIVDYFLTFPDLYHHPKEDMIFEKLVTRAPDKAATFGDLEVEHEKVSERLRIFTRAVVNVLMDAEMPRDAFVEVATAFIDGERKHMRAEETHFFPAARETLTKEDWRDLDARLAQFKDPLSDDELSRRFHTVTKHLR